MQDFQLFVKHQISGKFINISEKSIPMILNKLGGAEVCLAYKNVSDQILSNISVMGTGMAAAANVTSAVTTGYQSPADDDYAAGISYAASPELKELYPGEMFKLYIRGAHVDAGGNPTNSKIDFSKFTLDLTYDRSLISLTDLEGFFEFTEAYNSATTSSSYPALTGTIINATTVPVIRGIGGAYLRSSGDRITYTTPTMTEISVLFKGIVDYVEDIQPILNVGNVTVGVDAARKPYVKINDHIITSDVDLYDYNEEALLGFSATTKDDVIIFIDGEAVETTLTEGVGADLVVITNGQTGTIGNDSTDQLYGDIDTLAIYSKYKEASFHTNFFRTYR